MRRYARRRDDSGVEVNSRKSTRRKLKKLGSQDAIGSVSMGLNHMNGRVQDAITGRFLSADPYIAEPGFTQAWNRYSYVNNNPMSFTDPSGFFPLCFTRFFPGPGGNSDGEGGGGGFHLGFGGFEADGGVYLFFCIAEIPDQLLLPPPNLDTPG
jgi:RHS repeat-associated protein